MRPEYQPDEKQMGHSMFEDEDDFEFTMRGGRAHGGKRRGVRKGGRGAGARALPRKKELQFGRLKSTVSNEDRIKKRKREEDEMEGEYHTGGEVWLSCHSVSLCAFVWHFL
jgi:hypothetical protein